MPNIIFGYFYSSKDESHPRLKKWEGERFAFINHNINFDGDTFLEISPYWFKLQVLANKEIPWFKFINVKDLALEYKVDVNNTFRMK